MAVSTLEGKELIVATKAFAEEDRAKSWWYTLSTVALLLGSFSGAVAPWSLAIRIPCSLLTSLLLLRLFTIYHDYLHHTIFKDSVPARILFTFFGLYTLNPPSIWKRSHDHHHKHNSNLNTSSIGSFPILTKDKFLALSKREQFKYLMVRHPLTIAAGYVFAFLWGMCLLSLIRNPSKHWDSAVALVMHVAVGVTLVLTLGWSAMFLGFLVPAIISSAMGSYLFYAQHNFPTATFTDQKFLDLYRCRIKIIELYANGQGHALVHRQYRLPPCTPHQRPDPLLPPARSLRSIRSIPKRKDHLAQPARHLRLPADEGVGPQGE